MIRIRKSNTSSRQKARGTYAKGTGMFPRMAGVQRRADGKSHQLKIKVINER